MSFSVGIVGLPNVGKSTLFTALTKKQVSAANYPFCTIEPNVGVVAVPDARLEALAKISNSAKVIATTVEFVDIAGLVKNAASGEGLGNKFLSHIREVKAIVQVVRDFSDGQIIHVYDRVDPEDDANIINLELVLADEQVVSKRLVDLQKQSKGSTDKNLLKKIEIYQKIEKVLADGQLATKVVLDKDEEELVKDLNLLTRKPILYVYNVAEKDVKRDPKLNKLQPSINICAQLESDLASLSDEEAKEYLKTLGLERSGLDQLIVKSYEMLDLITYLTTGPDETRAWTVKKGSTAPEAAGEIHTDFIKHFIRAEVYPWQELVNHGSELALKEAGIVKVVGKDYVVQDGDVCFFRVDA